MYNAPDDADSEDWIELYNPTASTVDMSNWEIKDEDDTHSFRLPADTFLPSGGFLVITQNLQVFNQFYSGVQPIFGDMDFGLAGGSDAVRLFDPQGNLIDAVTYDDEAPWDPNADGTGFSLELTDANSDNSLPSSWSASNQTGGTPGAVNSTLVSNEYSNEQEIPSGLHLHQNYPNPFNPTTKIQFDLPEMNVVSLRVFDAVGREMAELLNGRLQSGTHTFTFDASGLSSGIYFYRLQTCQTSIIKKMLLIE